MSKLVVDNVVGFVYTVKSSTAVDRFMNGADTKATESLAERMARLKK